jgi:hypothetical protein
MKNWQLQIDVPKVTNAIIQSFRTSQASGIFLVGPLERIMLSYPIPTINVDETKLRPLINLPYVCPKHHKALVSFGNPVHIDF